MTFVPNYPFELPARQPVSRLCPCIIIGTFAICANQNGYKPAFSPQLVHPRDANRRQPLPHHFASETFEGQRTLSECKLAGTKIHKPEKDEMPCLSDPGPLNIRRPHPHRVQPTEAGCRNIEPNRKKTMEKIVCIGERSWQRLLERVEHLSALAQRLERRLTPPQDDG